MLIFLTVAYIFRKIRGRHVSDSFHHQLQKEPIIITSENHEHK